MPLGPFGEVMGTTGTLHSLGEDAQNYATKVVAPRNPKLVRTDDLEQKMSPSKFLFEVSLTTDQKLANTHIMRLPRKIELLDMSHTTLQKFSQVNIDEPLFQPYPSEVFFQNYEPFNTYSVPLVLRNNDRVPRLVKVYQEDSPYFKVISPTNVGNKVGPGLPTTFTITFRPDQKKDYKHELICMTEREKFVVPVQAIGARAVLDFPDDIHFCNGAVKYANAKTLLIRNIGNREAKFSLETEKNQIDQKPFTVTPEIGTLAVNDNMQVTIEFNPLQTGNHYSKLIIHYDTGEDVYVSLYGAAQDANVRLERNSIGMEDTYLSLASQRSVTINNRSNFIAHFRWTQFATQEEEDQQKLLQQIELNREENADTDRFLEECMLDPTLRDKLSILSRSFQNRKRVVERDPMLFDDDVIKIEPAEGDIWPNSSFQVMVIFKPREATNYSRTAFCDITGRQSRLPLRISGEGAGPKVEFSFDDLDMRHIFMGSRHTYEVVMANKGDIDAIFSIMPNSSLFGPCFSFTPSEGIVMPGGMQAIQVAFSCPYLGDFVEEFFFQVDGSSHKHKVIFRGSVIGPTFEFDIPIIKFGTVSYGFKHSRTCKLINTSLVPLSFHLRVPGDGLNPSICATSDLDLVSPRPASTTPRLGLTGTSVREFDIQPSSGSVAAQSSVKITVTLTSNQIRKYDNVLVVDIQHVGEDILSIPMSAKCMVPHISIMCPLLDFGRCFLRSPYSKLVTLHNDTLLPAKYIILPQEQAAEDPPPITYSSPQPKGIIQPHSTLEVPLEIQAQILDEQELPCYIAIFGSPEPPMHVHLVCIGEGPVVHIYPPKLDWGNIQVLLPSPQTITLSNESLIASRFTARMMKPRSVFSVSPNEAEIPPQSSLTLTVTATLNDCIKFQDKLHLNFKESQARTVSLLAVGSGTTIFADPPLSSILDLGHNFSNRPLKRTFKLTNLGRRHQQLMWSTEGFGGIVSRPNKGSSVSKEAMNRSRTLQPIQRKPVFSVSPARFELHSGETIEFALEGMVPEPRHVEERIICHAILGRQGGKELIMTVDVHCEFVCPLLEFSTKSIFFRVDTDPRADLKPEMQSLHISNVSSLPLSITLELKYPFSIVLPTGESVQETDISLGFDEHYDLQVAFNPAFREDLHTRCVDEVMHINYKEHAYTDYIALRGEVYFPNLEFEKNVLNFGCILNDTEVTRYVNITNNSPMQVRYRWSFMTGNAPTFLRRIIRHGAPHMPRFSQDSVLASEAGDLDPDEEENKSHKEEVAVEAKASAQAGGEAEDNREAEETRKVSRGKSFLQTQNWLSSAIIKEEDEEVSQDEEEEENKEEEELLGLSDDIQQLSTEEDMEKGQLEELSGKESTISQLSKTELAQDPVFRNQALSALLEKDCDENITLGIEEVFDILPLYGTLEPGDTEQVTFTFFGHSHIFGEARAICEIDGGPSYELTIIGEASRVEYRFDSTDIQFGKQMYSTVAVAELTLLNTGKVAFEYRAINIDPSLISHPQAGQPVLVPHSGIIEPFSEQKLQVRFLPGVPEFFKKSFSIQVAHFVPELITLSGEGVFPRLNLDLPRNTEDEEYQALLKEARENLMPDSLYLGSNSTKEANLMPDMPSDAPCAQPGTQPCTQRQEGEAAGGQIPTELDIQMEVERLAVRNHAQQAAKLSTLAADASAAAPMLSPSADADAELNSSLEDVMQQSYYVPVPPSAGAGHAHDSRQGPRRKKLKPKLPEYLLDFGYVVLGSQKTHVVRATNTGWCSLSFKVERGQIFHSGFMVELDKVRNLPGAPDNETVDFMVAFDPRGANLQLGPVEAVVPIQIINGPVVVMRLRAHVTMPDMEISEDVLDFWQVKCGECKVLTVQIHNHQHVKCNWVSKILDEERKKPSHRHMPLHLRRKIKQEKKTNHFEILPSSGSLMPGQRFNIQIKFMPTEEKYYEQRIPIKIAQSSQRLLVVCRGEGLEPRLEFERQPLVEFGPILPHSGGDEQDIIIRNPTSFPIEFYSLEFDPQYLEEEKVLRLMRGYDDLNTILLPPRVPGEKLPHELLDYYEEQLKKLEEEDRAIEEARQEEIRRLQEDRDRDEQSEETKLDDLEGTSSPTSRAVSLSASNPNAQDTPLLHAPSDHADKKEEDLEERMRDSASGMDGVGELEITPVSAAIARHLGIDLSVDGKAARNRRGISIIVHGAPLSGKTTAAVMLARRYEAAILTLDGVVLDAIANGNSAAGLKARQMCAEAARRKAEETKAEQEDGDRRIGGLSVEAVTAHTMQGTGLSVAPSMMSRKISNYPDSKARDKHGGGKGGNTLNTSSIEGGTVGSQGVSSPPPLAAPIARRLSISASVTGEEGLMSCVLPEDLLVEILSERLQLSDCHRGVVIDGLETLFAQNMFTAINVILKALNNRRFMFFCNLKLDYNCLKELEKKEVEEKEKAALMEAEQERLRLEDMDEDEYDALSDTDKALIDGKRLVIKKARIKRDQEIRAERERKEREAREEEERRREEEMRHRRGKKKLQIDVGKDKKGVQPEKKGLGGIPMDKGKSMGVLLKHDADHKVASSLERPESHQTERSDEEGNPITRQQTVMKIPDEDHARKKKGKGKDKGVKESDSQSLDESMKDPVKEAELLLVQRFRTFECSSKDISDLLELWDRTTLQIRRPPTPSEKSEEEPGKDHPPSGKKSKGKDRHEKEKEKEREKQRQLEKEQAERAAKEAALAEEAAAAEDGEEGAVKDDESAGVPVINVDCSDRKVPAWQKLLDAARLPSPDDVMDGLGMGPNGPPIPPAATFAVVPFPVKRKAPALADFGGRYTFVASSPDDPNVAPDPEKMKEVDPEEEKSVTPEKMSSKEDREPSRGRSKGSSKTADKGPGGQDTSPVNKERRRSADRNKRPLRHGSFLVTPPPGASTPASDSDNQGKPPGTALTSFRWMIPAQGQTVLRLRFVSEELGQFDQTLNFEIVGTRRRYQLFCRGVCAFPTISREPRIVFPSRKKNKKPDEIIHKKYILNTEVFEFGPLLVGKSRERYKEGKFPENMETITISNTSPLDADVSFCFLNDSKGETFLMEPSAIILKPGTTTELMLWAYPKGPGRYEDAVVCCIRENPEPVIFKVACEGCRPELELDKKVLHFDKVLIHRKDTKTLYLRNTTQLPVAWRLSGLENLGEDFTVAADSGVVEPLSEYPLQAYFRAMKPVQTNRKMIRLEISDVENIMGVVHTEPIQVIAEAYDVALDMSFPKGTDGGLDFGIIRVNEEKKEICTLKNKGKYEIVYSFILENCDPANPELASLFSVVPPKATLGPADRPTQVQVVFKSSKEIQVKEQPVLKCHVIEPSLGEEGEVIANIPVKISVKAVYSKFHIVPTSDINFGSLLVNSKKTRTFVIENRGDYDFKYIISKMVKDSAGNPAAPKRLTKDKHESGSGRSVKPKKPESVRQDQGQSRLTLGMFTVFPAFGSIPTHNQQTITIDCVAEAPGRCEEEIIIDITERDPKSYPGGIPYKLLAEGCVPSISIDNFGQIFEEHRVCKNILTWQQSMDSESGGIYAEEERRFVFHNIIVGRKAKARFKIMNSMKVPCDVVCQIKQSAAKGAHKVQDIFEVDPARTQLPSHGFLYVTVTFSPPAMQSYYALFEASIEGVSPNQARGKSLTFELAGEGNLPRVTVTRPTVRNKRGQPLLLFKKILLGSSQTLPLELKNDATLPCKVDMDLMDGDGVFTLQPTGNTQDVIGEDKIKDAFYKRPHTASVIMNPGDEASFIVVYRPSEAVRSQGQLRLSVVDNQYEDCAVQLVGEGYLDDITLTNISCSPNAFTPPEAEEGTMADDDVEAAKPNLMRFGDCYINESRTLSVTMTNHSSEDCIRFAWPDHPKLRFSPQVGHLHAGCSKDIAVTFLTDSPTSLEEEVVSAAVTKVTFEKPANQVWDWDDRIRTVKWVDATPTPTDKVQPTTTPQAPARPLKKKVVETEPEPAHTELPESARNVDLLVSAVADFCQFTCSLTSMHFKDTLMFQTRLYELVVENTGRVALDYNWQVRMESKTPPVQRSVTFLSEGEERPESRVDLLDDSYIPFSVEPQAGSILPEKRAVCLVKFSPLEINEYEGSLVCSIPNADKEMPPLTVSLKGRSLMPFCHLDLEDSDYITGARRNPELRGPNGAPPGTTLDPTTRVLEFEVVGLGVQCVKEFSIINPTNELYQYEWISEDEADHRFISSFEIKHLKGEIRSGRKTKASVKFASKSLGVEEAFWRFHIPQHNISIPFLLVGTTREPSIGMDRSHLNFKALLLGREAMETVYLINSENTAFAFQFLEESCHSEGFAAHLVVEPMSGEIPAKSRLAVNLFFAATSEKEVNFNLHCKIQRRLTPVMLNIKAEGYSMNCTLLCEDSTGNKVPLSSRGLNVINFNDVEVNEHGMRHLFAMNSGKFNFDYTWELNEQALTRKGVIQIDKMQGSLNCGDTQQFMLSFRPPQRMTLKGYEASLKITNGPTFTISVQGHGVVPGLHLSFTSHNFGNVFIHRASLCANGTTLRLTNKDTKEISVDCLYEPTVHLQHNFEARVLPGGMYIDIPFGFFPQEARKYTEVVTFEVNGLSRQSVEFTGTGCDLKIETVDPKYKQVKLGAHYVGDVVKRYIPIVNRSPLQISFTLAFTPTASKLQLPDVISIAPTGPIKLAPKGGTTKVEVVFRPKMRIPPFTEEVLVECAGMSQPLFVLRGSCVGMDVNLDTESIPFGTVYHRSQTMRKLIMTNTGDMNSRFRWDLTKFLPDFSISPVEGYITSGMDVSFDVFFHPQNVCQDIRKDKLRCFLDGGPHKPLMLTLTGSCTNIPPIKDVQNFSAQVRGRDVRLITIPNRTNQTWELAPIIEGEFWSGPITFSVEPQQVKQYELTYKPLTMTSEHKKHQGTIFFPLPDGTGLLYNLVGTAEAPRPSGRIIRDVPCKSSYAEPLSVSNWLKKPQRFRVKIEPIKPDKLDPGTTVKGMEYIDVPPNSKKDYSLNFYAYREGLFLLKITFIHDQSGEYQFYEIQFRATKPGVIATLELTTPVRQSVPHTIQLENPLPNPLTFLAACNVPEILMPSNLSVPPHSIGQFHFEYQPLKVGEGQGKIEFHNNELGQYVYDLNLHATTPCPEKPIFFRATLGQSHAMMARFLNFAKQKTDYICKVDSTDFHVDKTVAAAPGSTSGTEIGLEVTFEPSRLGEQRTTLTVHSSVGGEYVFPLHGTCSLPKPQGPFQIKAGATLPIMFRNIFSSPTAFTFQVDNPLFHLPKQGENIRPRKEHRIVVGFDGNDSGSKAPVMGRLVVSCRRSAGGNACLEWVYYLKGVTP